MKIKRSSLLTKLLITLLAIAATVTLVVLQGQLSEKEQQLEELERQAAVAREENQRLQDAIDAVGTDEGYADMARQDGMAAEGEIIFYDIGD